MEREFYTDEFEQLLKEKSDQFRMYPSKRVWHSIYNDLHPSRRWPSAAMSLLLIFSLVLIGYLNTGDNTVTRQYIENNADQITDEPADNRNSKTQKQIFTYSRHQQSPVTGTAYEFQYLNLNKTEFFAYTIVKNNKPNYFYAAISANPADIKTALDKKGLDNNSKDFVQTMDNYIKSNQIYTDIAVTNKKKKAKVLNTDDTGIGSGKITTAITASLTPVAVQVINSSDLNKVLTGDEKTVAKNNLTADKESLTAEEKAWIENFALHNKPASNKWKGRLAFEFYATPAVNYRKLSTNSKGSATLFANSDINNSISQKPGLGLETGVGLSYAIAKKLQLKAGFQFNYTNYNINADQTNHPILTTILLNDPNTGFSYSASRTSTISNAYNSAALQPVTLHNRTYQISIPVGFAYKLSGHDNVEWFTGASVQPTYVFGGKAHLISSDLKSYVSDPSSIRNWNLSMGFETYMNFKLRGYNLQVGPQVRYQLFSTYNKNIALIEKPYAVGLKVGLIKGF